MPPLNSSIRFSVIVPMYNVAEYIRECIESVHNQTYRNFELIIIDDQSTDLSIQQCFSLLDRIPEMTLLGQHGAGPNVARNLALEYATGDYVVFVDADDKIEPYTLEKLAFVITANKPDLINFGFDFFDSETNRILKKSRFLNVTLQGESIFTDALKGTNLVGVCWNKCYQRAMIEKYALRFTPDRQHGRDIIFTRQCALVAKKAVILSTVFYHSRFRKQSFSRSFGPSNISSALDLAQRQIKIFNLPSAAPNIRVLLDYSIGRHLRYILILSAFRSQSFVEFSANVRCIQESAFWLHAVNALPTIKALVNAKDRLLSALIKSPRLCWLIARMLHKLNYQPY